MTEEKKPEETKPKTKRGFASMTMEQRRAIARKGGIAAHARGAAHHFTSDEARAAGRKGGIATSKNAEHMAEIGRRGGANSHKKDGEES